MTVHTENDLEIELKLLAPENAGDIIQRKLLPILEGTITQSKIELSNDYFDTPDRLLRKHNIGFRIRGCMGVYEQTLKTAGKTVGGLHQRPEFNVPLIKPIVTLSLFDKNVWPSTIDVSDLQEHLSVIFSTRFTRHIYLITFADDSAVELVWDSGEIVNNRQREQICELELELKCGGADKLFTIAKQIVGLMPVRIGNASKAARGYALCDGVSDKIKSLPESLEFTKDDNIETALIRSLEVGLAHWQHHEKQFLLNTDATALHHMYQGVELIFSTLVVYQSKLHCKHLTEVCKKLESWMSDWQWRKEYYAFSVFSSANNLHSKKLAKSPQLVKLLRERADDCVSLYHPKERLLNPSNMMLQLEISEMLLTMPWRHSSDSYLFPLQKFAEQQDQLNQKIIIDIMSKEYALQGEDYICHATTIRDVDRQGYLFGALTTSRSRLCYALWHDLAMGINELELWLQLMRLIDTSNIDDKEALLAWCKGKMSKLNTVMERSREEALSMILHR